MNDRQFKVLITRLNLIIDLMIEHTPNVTVELSETGYQITRNDQLKAVVVQDDGNALIVQKVIERLRAGIVTVEARGA